MPLHQATPTLLLIDDEPAMHELFQSALQGMGIRLFSARSASEGLAVFSREQPGVVVLDIGLPDMSGLEAFRQLHRLDARLPVIFITGAGTTATAIEAMS